MPGQGQQAKDDHQKKLDELKAGAQSKRPTENEKKDHATIYAQKGKIKFGEVEEEVDIITVTEPNATGGYDVKVHLPFCPITSVTNQ